MDSSQWIERSYSRLQDKLGELLRGQSPRMAIRGEKDYPLLVLETFSDSAGFAIVDSLPERSYASSYSTFKQLYRENHETWKSRNLSFVVCSGIGLSSEEGFLSSIVSDIYFCKKYVVYLGDSEDELEHELRRLPFLPLEEGYKRDTRRPISAQSLLQEVGLPPRFARNLIVSGKRSAEGIIDDLLENSVTLPQTQIGHEHTNVYKYPVQRARLKGLVVEGFRAYSKRQEFDLDADIVVLYGQNGLGKTSFFDAVDYLTTGRIGRLSGHYKGLNSFVHLARNLATNDGGYVRGEVGQGGSSVEIVREITDWSYTSYAGERSDRWNTLKRLTMASKEEKRERIEIFEKLFRATHFFGQTQAELLSEFDAKSILSFDILSRMLALEDYATGISKMEEVEGLLERKHRESRERVRALEVEIENLQVERRKVPGSLELSIGPQLTKMVEDLRPKIRNYVVVDEAIESELHDELVRHWRSMLEAEMLHLNETSNKLGRLQSEFDSFEAAQLTLSQKSNEIGRWRSMLRDHQTQKAELDSVLDALNREVDDYKESLSVSKTRLRKLSDFEELQQQLIALREGLNGRLQEVAKIDSASSTAEVALETLISDVQQLEAQKARLEKAVNAKMDRIETLTQIQENADRWLTLGNELQNVRESIMSVDRELFELRRSLDQQEEEELQSRHALAEMEQALEIHNHNNEDLSALLDEVERFVNDGVCPVCGTDHESRALLLERIRSQKGKRPVIIENLVRSVNNIKERIATLAESIAKSNRVRTLKEAELEKLNTVLDSKREVGTEFESLLDRVDAETKGAILRDIRKVGEIVATEVNELNNLKENLAQVIELESAKISDKEEWEMKRQQLMQNRHHLDSIVVDLKARLEGCVAKMDELDLPIGLRGERLTLGKVACSKEIDTITSRLRETIEKQDAVSREMDVLTKTLDSVNQNLERLIDESEEAQLEVDRYIGLGAGAIQVEGLSKEVIARMRADVEFRIGDLQKIIHEALILERALSSAQRSVMIAEMDSRIREKQIEVDSWKDEVSKFSDLWEWIDRVKEILNKQSASAIQNYVEILGPLSSVIQARLQSPYGFGEISLSAQDNDVLVEVDWNGQRVKPVNYFSDSQKQILMLSLFLSSRLTQSWSGFAPILMDDPVTHFDDLNAFGFVELIRGLASTSNESRQFIISTCETRLYELMKSKFSRVKGGAIFYEFTGINSGGPIVSRLGRT